MCQNATIPCDCGCSGTGLGLTATSKRHIKSGYEYDQYFDLSQLKGTNPIVATGNTHRSLGEMEKLVKATKSQTAKIAQKLKGHSLINTLSNIWHFLYDHVQYTLDAEGEEQLRTPLRTWKDRAKGVDCDCYSIFISSILHNLGIPHAFRMTKYGDDWQHVYVVVPKDGKKASLEQRHNYYAVDPVVNQFNYETPFTQKHDRYMDKMPIRVLNGVGLIAAKDPCALNSCERIDFPRSSTDYIAIEEVERNGDVVTEKLLNEIQVPYQITMEEGKETITVASDTGSVKLPTTITAAEAEVIKTTAEETPGDFVDSAKTAGIGNGWIVALIGVGIGVAILAANRPNTPGLSGTKKPTSKKRKTASTKKKKPPVKISI